MLVDKPSVEDVHDGVVHDVERIGEIAKGFVDAMSGLGTLGSAATGTEPYEHGEDEGYTSKLVQAVEVDHSHRLDVGNREQGDEHKATHPECSPHLLGLEGACNEHTQGKGKEHTQESAPEVDLIDGPAHTHHAISRDIAHEEPGMQHTQHNGEHGQHLGRQTADEEGVENITNIRMKNLKRS